MKNIIRLVTQTSDQIAPLVARLTLALIFFPHGAQKVLGWFGGYGFQGTMGFLTGMMHLPYVIALLPILTEFFGAIALFLGLFTRVAALATAVNMLVAIVLVHAGNGFFMNWTGKQAGEGFEYHLLAIGLAVAVLISGAGRLSIDRAIAGQTAASE